MEEQESENFLISPHPLLIPPVVQKLMSFLQVGEILNSRLVCREWSKSGGLRLREIKIIKFRKFESLEKYVDCFEQTQFTPYVNFELEYFNLEDNATVERFFRLCSSNISSLQLNSCSCSQNGLFKILSSLSPSLTKLSLQCDPIQNSPSQNSRNLKLSKLKYLSLFGHNCSNSDLVKSLLKSSPFLLSVQFGYSSKLNKSTAFEEMCLRIFLDINTNSSYSNLQEFITKYQLSDSEVLELGNVKLVNLTKVCLGLSREVNPKSIGRFLENISNTLCDLELEFEEIVQERKFCSKKYKTADGVDIEVDNNNKNNGMEYFLPPMPKLARLYLTNYRGSLIFLNFCQNLKYLSLINSSSYAIKSFTKLNVHPNLIYFKSNKILDKCLVRTLATSFPSLKILSIVSNDEIIGSIFEHMGNLEEILLSGDNLTDLGITGISVEDYEKSFISGERDVKRVNPFIGDLKYLRRILIQNAGCITDASIVYGISHCENLVEINLLNAKVFTDISLESIGCKLLKLKKLEILSSKVPQLTSRGKSLIRHKLPQCEFILGPTDILNIYSSSRSS